MLGIIPTQFSALKMNLGIHLIKFQFFFLHIVAQIYGHTHTDSFKLLFPEKLRSPQTVSNVDFMAPSVTPLVSGWPNKTSTNPGM